MLTPQKILYKGYRAELTPENTLQKEEQCIFCGIKTVEMFPVKQYIKTGFMNWDAFKNPSGEYICKYCAFSMGEEFRRTSYIASEDNYFSFKNVELENLIWNIPVEKEKPFIFCITTSYKKHNCFRARVNYSQENYFIRWEEKLIEIDTKKHKPLFDTLQYLYSNGFNKGEIRSGIYYQKRIQEFGLQKFLEYEEKIKPFRGSGVFDLFMDNKSQIIQKKEALQEVKEEKPIIEKKEAKKRSEKPKKKEETVKINFEEQLLF